MKNKRKISNANDTPSDEGNDKFTQTDVIWQYNHSRLENFHKRKSKIYHIIFACSYYIIFYSVTVKA